MTPGDRLRNRYADQNSIYYRFRKNRSVHIRKLIDAIYAAKGSCRIIDIGGEEAYWKVIGDDYLSQRNVSITLVNLSAQPPKNAIFTAKAADACALPFENNSFDLAHSNSVIEHVGSIERKMLFAKEAARVAPSYFVQTPNFWFPYEPHLRMAFIHYLPVRAQAFLALALQRNAEERMTSYAQALQLVKHNALLSEREMRRAFPGAKIIREKFFGLTKSIMAIRDRSAG